jgi:hypothetical protein
MGTTVADESTFRFGSTRHVLANLVLSHVHFQENRTSQENRGIRLSETVPSPMRDNLLSARKAR